MPVRLFPFTGTLVPPPSGVKPMFLSPTNQLNVNPVVFEGDEAVTSISPMPSLQVVGGTAFVFVRVMIVEGSCLTSTVTGAFTSHPVTLSNTETKYKPVVRPVKE